MIVNGEYMRHSPHVFPFLCIINTISITSRNLHMQNNKTNEGDDFR